MKFISEKIQNAVLVVTTRYGRYLALALMVALAAILYRCGA